MEFRINEVVLCKDYAGLVKQSIKFGNIWKRGRIVDKINFNVYVVQLDSGKKLKVNSRKIRKLLGRKVVTTSRKIKEMNVVEDDEDLDDYVQEEFVPEPVVPSKVDNVVEEQDTRIIHPYYLTDKEIKDNLEKKGKKVGSKADERAYMEAQYLLDKGRRTARRKGGRM